jgi:hypothetical protein
LKTLVSLRASVLFLILGLIQVLLGQTPSPRQPVVSKSQYVAEAGQNKSLQFSNGAGEPRKRLRVRPDTLNAMSHSVQMQVTVEQ